MFRTKVIISIYLYFNEIAFIIQVLNELAGLNRQLKPIYQTKEGFLARRFLENQRRE
jgi:hypothetical protein